MKTFKVSSLPINEVIQDMAKAFNTYYREDCNYYSVQLPAELGSGQIEGMDFQNGIGIIHYKCTFKEDIAFQFDLNCVHPLKFIFCYKGILEHKFTGEKNSSRISHLQNTVVASKQKNGHVLVFKANTQIHLFSAEISRKDYNQLADCDLKSLTSPTESLFRDLEGQEQYSYKGYYSLKIAHLINDINRNEDTGFQKKLFYQSKSFQFIKEQIDLIENTDIHEEKKRLFGSYEVQQIDKAAEIIRKDLSEVYTIEKLSQKTGMNKNKLQKGFKLLFNMTVNEYIKSERLIKAVDLITNSDLNISEIVSLLGIKSKSYFSKIFKKEFGLTPQEYQREAKKQ